MTRDAAPPDSAARQKVSEALGRLAQLHPKLIDLSLGRVERLLDALGRPQDRLPPVLHIAGTNGKGSVVATARAIAEAAGLRTHVYISPHLVRFNERIRIAGSLIGDEDLAALLEEVEAANGAEPITFFEITTAAAFLAFSRTPADLCILEVGLGGRLDATNVIAEPAAIAITPISLDHQSFLGPELTDIAREKAGIMKAGAPAVIGPQNGVVDQFLRREARRLGVMTHVHGRHWRAGLRTGKDGETRLVYKDDAGIFDFPAPVLVGPHQAGNAGTAIALMRHQQAVQIPEAAIRAGLGWVRWPARMQKLESGPLRAQLPDAAELWLDGGHNPAAAQALRETLIRMTHQARPIDLVIGMMGNRNPLEFLQPFAGLIRTAHGVTIPGVDNPAAAADIAAAASSLGIRALVAGSVAGALNAIARTDSPEPPLVLIAGSLYLAGHVLAENGPLPD